MQIGAAGDGLVAEETEKDIKLSVGDNAVSIHRLDYTVTATGEVLLLVRLADYPQGTWIFNSGETIYQHVSVILLGSSLPRDHELSQLVERGFTAEDLARKFGGSAFLIIL